MRADTWFQHIYPFTVDLKCCNWTSFSGISLCWNQSQSLFFILHCGQSVLFGDLVRACQNRTRWCFSLSTAVKSGGWSWLWRSKERDRWVKEAEIRIEGLTSSGTVQTEAVWEIGKKTEEWWLIQEKGKKSRHGVQGESGNQTQKRGRGKGGLDWGGTGTQLRTDTIIVIQPALEPSQRRHAQLEALGEMKGRGVWRSTKLQCCTEHEKAGEW